MPYVTEEIWSGSGELQRHLGTGEDGLLVTAAYPAVTEVWRDEDAEHELGLVLDVVRAIRNLRRERNIDAGRWLEAYVVADTSLAKHGPAIEQLARVRPLHVTPNRAAAPSEQVATAVLDGAIVILPMAGLFDAAAERTNLEKQLAQAQSQVESLERQLSNEGFTSRAPANVIAEARERLEAARSRLSSIEARLGELR
jgi:valyl-tRNA synthetase